MRIDEKTIESQVVSHYLASGDYNGLPFSRLASDLGADPKRLLEVVVPLVRAGRVSLPSPFQTNPHVKMFKSSIEEQLRWFDERESRSVCLYPTAVSMAEAVDLTIYDDTPFTKMMKLASPKLLAIPLRLDVLDFYERDARYWFRFYGFGGTISAHSDQVEEPDRIELDFGVGYDDEGNRVVAVYLYQLASLPGRQQRIWKDYRIDRECRMSEEFFVTTILAQPAGAISHYEAIICEQVEINKLFKLMGRQPLFSKTFEDEQRPRGFSFFVKPTQEKYDAFVLLLEKMLSENINVGAFGGEVAQQDRVEVSDGVFEVRRKASISLLEEWLSLQYPSISSEERSTVIRPIKKVRKLRQKPAHEIADDKYDKKFYDLQDKLVREVYDALSKLRHILTMDPSVSEYEPPSWDGRLTVKSF